MTIVLLAAYGNDGLRLTFGVQDFLGVGTSLGLVIVVPLILISYVFGASLFVMVSASKFPPPKKVKTLRENFFRMRNLHKFHSINDNNNVGGNACIYRLTARTCSFGVS